MYFVRARSKNLLSPGVQLARLALIFIRRLRKIVYRNNKWSTGSEERFSKSARGTIVYARRTDENFSKIREE